MFNTKAYLDSFINYEKRTACQYHKDIKLERVKLLCDALAIKYQDLAVIHVAGTKGKGSVVAYVSALLASGGYKVGVYTSPHLYDLRERIKIITKDTRGTQRSHLISRTALTKIVTRFQPGFENFRFQNDLGFLSFFEVYTAIALQFFVQERVDYAVIEVGLGGRLDATNIVHPLVSVITHIGYDHMQKLGTQLSQIAGEKAGIIKPCVPVVSVFQHPDAMKVIQETAAHKRAELYVVGEHSKVRNIKLFPEKSRFDFNWKGTWYDNLEIRMKGRVQVENAATALSVVSLLQEKDLIKSKIDFWQSLWRVVLPGRFEIVKQDPLIIIDVAHNVSSFSALQNSLEDYFPKREVILIFAASKDKDIASMLRTVKYSTLIITTFDNPRCQSPEIIAELSQQDTYYIEKKIENALRRAFTLATDSSVIVVSGSLFLAAQAQQALSLVR